ncbi:outer membrane protein assembly factor BamE [Methylophaga sp.]|uniref:outer membrane protein assembly factor BamE n=1 Tax=Methylophaga sp. TaxID=2024840 RepID=UPI003F698A52
MKSFVVYSLSLAFLLSLSACSTDKIPGVYRIDIQQGNDVTQEMINQLEPGMTKNQVAYVMGTPLLIDTFHPNRWDYLYSYQPGGEDREQRRITLLFDEEEKLTHLEGNTNTVASRADLPEQERQDKNVVVPLTEKKTGFFNGFMNFIGLGGDDEVEIIEDEGAEDNETEETAAVEETEAEDDSGPTE